MRFERKKTISAVASFVSVTSLILASVITLQEFDYVPSQLSLMSVSVIVSVFSAVFSVFISRQLANLRKARNVFVIYVRDDLSHAKRIVGIMKKAGFNPWLDIEQILPGQVWEKEALKALEESSVAVILLSENFDGKRFAQKELDSAMKLLQSESKDMMPIIPVRLDETPVPKRLAHIQCVDISTPEFEKYLLKGLAHATGLPFNHSIKGLVEASSQASD